MAESNFFKDYLDEVLDDEAYKKIVVLEREYNQKTKEIDDRASKQQGPALLHKQLSGKDKIINASHEKTSLTNEYKKKLSEIAKPHMEAKKHQELSKKHAPEFQPESDRTMRQLGETQEKMLDLKKEQKEKTEAKQERKEESLEQEKARKVAELLEKMNNGKEKQKEESHEAKPNEKGNRENEYKELLEKLTRNRDDLTQSRDR